MNKINEKRFRINKRIISILMIACLVFGVLPSLNIANVKAADSESEDPLKDLVFDDSNTVTLDLFNGSFIKIYEDGYTQSTSYISTTESEVKFTGNYIIKGVTTKQLSINKVSGDSDIKISKVTSSYTVRTDLTVMSDTNIFIDTHIKVAKPLGVSVGENVNLNLKGFNNDYNRSDTIEGGLQLPHYTLGNIHMSNLTVAGGFTTTTPSLSTTGGTLGIYNCVLNSTAGSGTRNNFYYNKFTVVNSSLNYMGFYVTSSVSKFKDVDILFDTNNMQNYLGNTVCDGVNVVYKGSNNYASSATFFQTNASVTDSTFTNINLKMGGSGTTAENSYNKLTISDNPNGYSLYELNSVKYKNFTKIFELNSTYSYTLDTCISIFDRVSLGGYIKSTDKLMDFTFTGTKSYVNTDGDYVYPTAIKVDGYKDCYITMEADEWNESARFLLDSYGYIYPWLTWGEHTITVKTEDGKSVETSVVADNSSTPNSVTVTPVDVVPAQKVNVGKVDTPVKYAFDSGVYIDSTSDANGDVEVPITVGSSKFTIKLDEVPTIVYTAEVTDDVIGNLTSVLPSITSQSVDNSYTVGEEMTLYVDVKTSDPINTLSYEWYKDGVLIPNITINVLNSIVTDDTYGTYTCKITESNGLFVNSKDIVVREKSASVTEDDYKALEDSYNKLQKEFNDLKNSYDTLVSENTDNEELLNTLRDKIAELEKEIADLNTSITEKDKTVADLSSTITNLTNTINSYNSLLESIRTILNVSTNDQIVPKIQDILAQLETLKKEYSDLSNEYDEYKTNAQTIIDSLTEQLENLQEQLDNNTVELDTVKKELADALIEINELRGLVALIKNELGVTDDTEIIPAIQALKDRIASLESQITTLERNLTEANKTITDLTNDKTSYTERLEDMKDLVDSDTTDDIESKIQDMKDLISEYEKEISQLEKDKTDLEKVVDNQKKEIEDLKSALNGNSQELLDRITELEKRVQELEDNNRDLSTQVDSLTKNVESLTKENTELRKQIVELQTALDTANDTIEELRKKVSDLTVENEEIKSDNSKLTQEVEDLKQKSSSNEELLKQIVELEEQVEVLKSQSNTTVTTPSTPTVSEDSVILQTSTNTEKIVSKSDNSVSANVGWEISTDVSSDTWSDSIDMADLIETTSTFTFYTGKDLAKTFSSYVEKTIVYARKKADPNNVYVCSFNVDKGIANYTSPIGTMTSDTKGVTFVYDESNTKVVNTTGKVKFRVDGNFGVAGKKGIYYKVVAVENDFDPDGSWIEVESNSFTVEVDKQVRVYIKYVDNYGNYTVSKTTVLDSSKRLDVPVLQFNKTVYLGNSYKLQLDTKGNHVMYKSSDILVATVDENGLVTAKYNGKAKINCTVFDEKGVLLYRYEVSVTVKESNDKTLSLKKNYSTNSTNDVVLQSYKLINKGKSTKLTVKADDNAKIMYITSDKTVATVNNKGIVTGKNKGTADITVVVYQNDKFYTYVVKVRVSDGTKDVEKKQYLS